MTYASLSKHYEMIAQLDTTTSQFLLSNQYPNTLPHVTVIINNLNEESKFPDQWKTARISRIPKVTNPTELKDYRPISILTILSKVYEKQVLHQITNFIETQQVYSKHQSRYRKNHSTATFLSKLYDNIKIATKQSELTMAVFTNYSKVFDI